MRMRVFRTAVACLRQLRSGYGQVNAGRLRWAAVAAGFLALCPASAQETISYAYDARGRLVGVVHAGTVNDGVTSCYSYDKADNRSNITVATNVVCAASTGINFSIDDVSATEGSLLVFTVTRSGSTAGTDTVKYATANGTASSGSDYNPLALATLIFSPGQVTKTVNVTTIDDALAESSETVLLNLSSPSSGTTISNPQGVGTINDNDSGGGACSGVSFTIASNAAVTEGTNSVFTVTKAGSTSSSCAVNYATANGTATAPGDYTAASNPLTFTSAQTSKTVSVTTIDDATIESTETFSMSLSAPGSGATLGTPSSATATINDNDSAGTCSGISFSVSSNGAVTEGANSVFTITKTGSTTGTCSVNYTTYNGFAVAGSDFTPTSGTAIFTSAQTSKTVTVATIDDSIAENDETFFLQLSAPSGGASIGTLNDVATIHDNDSSAGPPTFAIGDATDFEGSTLLFTVTKTGTTSSSLTVNYVTANGTAIAGYDYTSASGSLTFGPTEVSKTLTVDTTLDTNHSEYDETFFVNLSGSGLTFTDNQGLGTIIGDCSSGAMGSTQSTEPVDGSTTAQPADGGDSVAYSPVC